MNRGNRKVFVTVALVVLAVVTALLIDVVTGTSGGASEPSHSTKTTPTTPGFAGPSTSTPVPRGGAVTFRTVGIGVHLRSAASTAATVVTTVPGLGSLVTLICYERGTPIGNDPWWYSATYGTARGYLAGYWVNTGPDPLRSRLPAC